MYNTYFTDTYLKLWIGWQQTNQYLFGFMLLSIFEYTPNTYQKRIAMTIVLKYEKQMFEDAQR